MIDKALAAGLSVNALAPWPEAVTLRHDKPTVFKRTPERPGDPDAAIAGCDGVITTRRNRTFQ